MPDWGPWCFSNLTNHQGREVSGLINHYLILFSDHACIYSKAHFTSTQFRELGEPSSLQEHIGWRWQKLDAVEIRSRTRTCLISGAIFSTRHFKTFPQSVVPVWDFLFYLLILRSLGNPGVSLQASLFASTLFVILLLLCLRQYHVRVAPGLGFSLKWMQWFLLVLLGSRLAW